MTATIRPGRWLEFLRTEYLDSFIRDGGSAVKFAVPLDEMRRPDIEDGIVRSAHEAGYIVVRASAADIRVHMVDQLFFSIAAQVPWRQLSQAVIAKLAEQAGYLSCTPGSESLVVRLAAANQMDVDLMRIEARKWIQNSVFRQQSLAKDFRVVVTHLCFAELSGGPDGETTIEVLTDWLTGRNLAVSAVKPYNVFSRVNRGSARHLFQSLMSWVRLAGHPGLVVVLDISRVTLARNPGDGRVYYSKAAVLDAYEVLREFIDDTDRMEACLMIVMPAREFLFEESAGRGFGAYDALKFRIVDEIRDERLVNPMGALVRLEE
ncbi:MAG: BREX system ATP-binding domain-containing protein [Chloroflexota bacterium]